MLLTSFKLCYRRQLYVSHEYMCGIKRSSSFVFYLKKLKECNGNFLAISIRSKGKLINFLNIHVIYDTRWVSDGGIENKYEGKWLNSGYVVLWVYT